MKRRRFLKSVVAMLAAATAGFKKEKPHTVSISGVTSSWVSTKFEGGQWVDCTDRLEWRGEECDLKGSVGTCGSDEGGDIVLRG